MKKCSQSAKQAGLLGLALCSFSLFGQAAEKAGNSPSAPVPANRSIPGSNGVTNAIKAVPAVGSPGPSTNTPSVAFNLQNGDRVVFLGDTLIEREQKYGFVEARLTVRYPHKKISFRNLGWSADTPLGQSRASFDWNKTEEDWLKQSIAQIAAVKPTVVFLGYGMASSFDGEAGLLKFKSNLAKLIDGIQQLPSGKPVRFVLLSPIPHENLGPPLPDTTNHNAQLALYTQAIKEIAQDKGFPFVNLFDQIAKRPVPSPRPPLTDDGIHLTAYGYSRMADEIEIQLGWSPRSWRIGITRDGKIRNGSEHTLVSSLSKTTNSVRFMSLDDQLANPINDGRSNPLSSSTPPNVLQVVGLEPGRYTLKVDGEALLTIPDTELKKAVSFAAGAQYKQAEDLRQTIIRKNELFFHRWRPENQTYLFGFRKQEQGQNAREIPQFDPLVQTEEEKIAKLRKPVSHTYEVVLADQQTSAPTPPPADANNKTASSLPVSGSERTVDASNQAASFAPLPIPQFDIAPGFEVNLFAENPLLAKPIQMNFDPKGRLWVVSSSVYPQIQPGQQADDKVLILEDTDGDGKADKSTVFAEGLLIPTGIEPGDGGCYVGQSTELLHFKDTDGDGKADQKRIVLSGFGTEDTHHILHTLRWGYDGQLYMNQSIYIHTHTETPHGVVRLNSGGILHLRPPTMEAGVFLRGFCNPWGHHYDEFGQSFVTDGAGFQGISYGMPGAMYFTYAGGRRLLDSISPGNYPKFCGLEIVHSQHFPDDWQGNIITSDFRAHRVVRFVVNEKESAYVTKEMPDLLRTTNVAFRPIDAKIGPDGALYIADWSNPIIQHGEVDFRDARRDHERGRIWRVTAKGRPLVEKSDLVTAANDKLLNELLSPNSFNQQQARRVLTERGTNIVNDLQTWVAFQSSYYPMLQALWMYQSVDVVEPVLLKRLLGAQDGRIRAAATRVLSAWHNRIENPVDLLAERVNDSHPRVRVEAVRALAQIPTARSAELVLNALNKPVDPYLEYTVWLSINDLAQPWVDVIRSGAWKIAGHEKELEFGLKAIEPALASQVLSQILAAKPIPRDGQGAMIELIGQAGGSAELKVLFDLVRERRLTEPAVVRSMKALSEAARLRKVKPSGD